MGPWFLCPKYSNCGKSGERLKENFNSSCLQQRGLTVCIRSTPLRGRHNKHLHNTLLRFKLSTLSMHDLSPSLGQQILQTRVWQIVPGWTSFIISLAKSKRWKIRVFLFLECLLGQPHSRHPTRQTRFISCEVTWQPETNSWKSPIHSIGSPCAAMDRCLEPSTHCRRHKGSTESPVQGALSSSRGPERQPASTLNSRTFQSQIIIFKGRQDDNYFQQTPPRTPQNTRTGRNNQRSRTCKETEKK